MPTTYRVIVPDKLAEEGLAYLRSQPNTEVVSKPGIKEDELAKIAGEFDGMIVRSGIQVTAKVLANPGRLKAIARAGVGVDNIDLEAATAAGILVMNSADASTITTAEHAFALLMALARQIGPAHKSMTEGAWDRTKFMGRQFHGKTLAVVGFGRIGRTVAERALAFGMKVIAFDPFINAGTALDGKVKMVGQFTDLLPEADAITFHVPLNDRTRSMMNAEAFAKARKGVLIVNAARGGIVDEAALIAALDSGKCGGAAIDVFDPEPPAADHPLRKHPKVLLTPHLGASTTEAQTAVSAASAEQLMDYLTGRGIRGAVNAGGLRVDLDPLQQRFVDLVHRMTLLLSPMITRGIASITFEVTGKALAAAAPTIERTGLVGLLQGAFDVPLNIINVTHIASQRGIAVKTVLTDDAAVAGGAGDAGGSTGSGGSAGAGGFGPQVTLVVQGPPGAVDPGTPKADQVRRIVGRVYQDLLPRVVEINGYFMDMVPAGDMVLIQNEDRPGMIGIMGSEFGSASVNIADMAISRRETEAGPTTALCLLKVDATPPQSLLNRLKARPGILKVAAVKLPGVKK